MYEYENQNPNNNYSYNAEQSAMPNDGTDLNRATMPVQPCIKQKKPHKFAKGLGKALAFGLVFGLAAGSTFQGVNLVADRVFHTESEEVAEVPQIGSVADSKPAFNQAASGQAVSAALDGTYTVSEIAQMCMPSVVAITSKGIYEIQSWFGIQQQESESAGSGIIVGQNDTELLIATNNHVVADANELSVCFNDNIEHVYQAQVKGTDAANDLAVISINLSDIPAEVLSTIKIAELGNSDELAVGEQVVAIGNALGYGQSVTSGYISALDREVNIDNMTADLIQTDAAINPGNSGGALFNMKGQVIGINSAKFASSKIEGMGYAIPISTALPILNNLENRVTRTKVAAEEAGYLGITCEDVPSDAQRFGIPVGVHVVEVNAGGASEQAGLRSDDIITKFDGLSISSVSELKANLQYYKAGETVELTVQRMSDGGYAEVTLTITLEQKTEQ